MKIKLLIYYSSIVYKKHKQEKKQNKTEIYNENEGIYILVSSSSS